MPVNPISGTDQNDVIWTTNRNDSVQALDGNDLILGNAGANTYDGGNGFDFVSYADQTGVGTTAIQGAVINFSTMLVVNPWGRQDVLTSVEAVKGSMLGDTYEFSSDLFAFQLGQGLAGRDVYKAQVNSHVWLVYGADADFGGTRGITVRFGGTSNVAGDVRGTVVDGFGDVDTVFGVQHVEGTAKVDRFYGSVLDDYFNGVGGDDFFNGGGGRDIVFLDTYAGATQLSAVRVDLALKGGEIINDGLGNTETATSIEGILGSALRDTIKGNAVSNYLAGGPGGDVLAGRGGADFFVYGFGNQEVGFGDTILDFRSGSDKIVLTDMVPGLTAGDAVRFSNGSVAGSADLTCIFFDAALQKLFLDMDGANGTAAAIEIATLKGVTTMTAHDIMIVDFASFW